MHFQLQATKNWFFGLFSYSFDRGQFWALKQRFNFQNWSPVRETSQFFYNELIKMIAKSIAETEKDASLSGKLELLTLLSKQNDKLISLKETLKGINPRTNLTHSSRLFFGIGGGNHKGLSQGLPFDVLAMILIGQKLKQSLGLNHCYVLMANQATCSNGFSQEKVDRLMQGQKQLLEIVLSGMDIERDWTVFLETEIKDVLGEKKEEEYKEIISDAQELLSRGKEGEYFCRETAATIMLAQNGIKLGWCADGMKGDEKEFDKVTSFYLEQRTIPNTISNVYTISGIRVIPQIAERAVPYAVYYPGKRILLHPGEKPIEKIQQAGGLWSKHSKRLFGGIASIFEEIILKEQVKAKKTEQKIAFMLDHIFKGQESQARNIWESVFLNQQKEESI